MNKKYILNRRLSLQKKVKIADDAGGYRTTWVTLGTVWSDMRALSGNEQSLAGGELSQMRYRIIVRSAPFSTEYCPKPDQRFMDGQRIFLIETVADSDRLRRYLTCIVREEILS